MGKLVKKLAIAIAIAVVVIAIGIATGGIATPFTFLGLKGAAAIVAAGAVLGALSVAAQEFIQKPTADLSAARGRLHVSLDPNAHGKWIFGETACATDLIYAEKIDNASNDDIFELFSAASHLIDSFGDLHLNDELITFTGLDADGAWNGILKRHTRLGTEVQTAIIPTGSGHPAGAQGKGIAQFGLVYNINEGQKTKLSSGGIPSRVTQEVKGAPVYDPRLDSTRGGTGAHRADNQATWEFTNGGVQIGENWALIVLFYLIGWRNSGELVFGVGVDLNDIDYAQVISAANICEELDGGEEKFFIGGILPTTNDHEKIIKELEGAIGGKVSRVGGKYFIWAPNDDLVSEGTINNDDLVVGVGIEFSPSAELSVLKNIARGTYVDPAELFQSVPYPDIVESTAVTDDGRDRILRHDFALVQTKKRAERVARMLVRRSRFTGSWRFAVSPKGLLFRVFDIITINFPETNNTDELVRIINMEYGPQGIVAMEVLEEDASIYDISAALGTAITQLDPSTFDPTAQVAVTNLVAVTASASGSGSISDAIKVMWDDPGGIVARTEVQYRITATAEWQVVPEARSDFLEALIAPAESNTGYDIRARHITVVGVIGDWHATVNVTTTQVAVARNTFNVDTQTAVVVRDATVNFNTRNDRIATAVVNPTVLADGTAIDHVVNTDGSVDLSFEWAWAGTEEDIDGFEIFVRSSSSGVSYVMGTTPAEEQLSRLEPSKRAFFLYGIPGDLNYTFGVRAFRVVDTDIDASRFKRSSLVQPGLAAEDPYKPETNIAFTGDISGTTGTVDWQTQVDGTGKPVDDADVTGANTSDNTNNVGSESAATVQNSTINFNGRNDRDASALTVPTILSDGTAIDHAVRTSGDVDMSFEWAWGGTESDIDGFAVYVRSSTSATSYNMGTTPAEEQFWLLQPSKRVFFLYGAPANVYYTFGVQAFRIVDPDVDASGFITTTIVQPTLGAEDPYQPEANVAFAGDVSGTVDGVAAATVQGGAVRANAGLDSSGDLSRDITIARADSSDVLRRSTGGLFTGELVADRTVDHADNLTVTEDGATGNLKVKARTKLTISGGAAIKNLDAGTEDEATSESVWVEAKKWLLVERRGTVRVKAQFRRDTGTIGAVNPLWRTVLNSSVKDTQNILNTTYASKQFDLVLDDQDDNEIIIEIKAGLSTADPEPLPINAFVKDAGIYTDVTMIDEVVVGGLGGTPVHNHDASDITASTLADARIAESNVTQHQAALVLAASQTTTGAFADARIPSLAASKITSGTFADARIAQSNVTQHEAALTLVASQIPNLDAGKITTGAFADARIPSLAASKIISGVFAAARIATHTGDVTGQTALTVVAAAITGKTALTTGLAGTDELLVSDAGVLKRMDISVMNAYFDANLSFAASAHSHTGAEISALDASDTTTGTFAAARIPTHTGHVTGQTDLSIHSDAITDQAELLSGVGGTDQFLIRIPSGPLRKMKVSVLNAYFDANLDFSATGHTHTGSTISALDTSDTTTGIFVDARIPNLAASKITSGTFAAARIPTHTGHVTGQTSLALVVAAITGQTALTSGLAGTDELLVSDAGVIKRMDISVMNAYFNANLNFNNYTHPGHPGDDFSVDSGALSGATVISDIDINVTTDAEGHVTDANGVIATRALTAANIGASATGHTHTGSTISALDAGDTTTGSFATARIPNLSASKITSGTFRAATAANGGLEVHDTSGVYKDAGFRQATWIDKSSSYTVTRNEQQEAINCTAALTIFLPNDGNIPNGAIFYIRSDTTGTVTVKADSGVTLQASDGTSNSAGSKTITVRYAFVTVIKKTNTLYSIFGDFA